MAIEELTDKDVKFLLTCFTCNRAEIDIDFHKAAEKNGMTLSRNW